MSTIRRVLVFGAGASLAAPARRPLFDWIREALIAPLHLDIDQTAWKQLAPEALLSRLNTVGIDIDRELRRMLAGGSPNALHAMAAEVLRQGDAVWTTNFDELIETAAQQSAIEVHRLLPDDDPRCDCALGHLIKVHGTLSGTRVVARSEEVILPLPIDWLERLTADFHQATVVLVGYAGADVDLRTGLHDALGGSASALWFGTPADREPLSHRFAGPLATNTLELRISNRPDLEALEWGQVQGLTSSISTELWTRAREPIRRVPVAAGYRANDLLRARVLDDFGRGLEARRLYGRALQHGPRRHRAARALYSSGLIHGAPWRPAVLAVLNVACAAPLPWRWPHRHRLPYLTWNVAPDKRLRVLERSLAAVGDNSDVLLAAANAAKEVDPRRAVELGRRAQHDAIARKHPPDLAWATFTLSFALRWLGDTTAASEQATRLTDGYDALAGPVWVAWGHFEVGALAALQGSLPLAQQRMQLAIEVFGAAGSMFSFDGWCGAIAVHRAAGDLHNQRIAYEQARRLLERDTLRRRFKREVLMVEEGEFARQQGRLDEAAKIYAELAGSPTVAQELLGLLGLGEVQRRHGVKPEAAWRALRRSDELGFGYGQVHAAVTLGLAGQLEVEEAERRIAASVYDPPVRDDATGLLRFCQGSVPEEHLLCFP